jgi:[protein-PII] uridylyltransferase
LWNEWKARLLADLYVAARYALRSGLERPPQADARSATCRARVRELLVEGGIDATRADALLGAFPEASFLRHRPEQVAWQARALASPDRSEIVIAIEPRSARGSSMLFVCATDRDGLFAAITATLDRLGFNIVAARLLVSADDRVFDSFELLDARDHHAMDAQRAAALDVELKRVLGTRDLAARVARRNLPRRLRHFQRAPQITFIAANHATQLALVCSDRPGVLAQIAQALRDARVRVHDARIATFGERVEDFFILTDEHGRALTEAHQARLRAILLDNLGASLPDDENGRNACNNLSP